VTGPISEVGSFTLRERLSVLGSIHDLRSQLCNTRREQAEESHPAPELKDVVEIIEFNAP
jgi:hypothetical protein